MPTILRVGGFRVSIYTQDHRPGHVHVLGNGQEAVFLLRCAAGELSLREQTGFREGEVRRIERLLLPYVADFCKAWRSIHGDA